MLRGQNLPGLPSPKEVLNNKLTEPRASAHEATRRLWQSRQSRPKPCLERRAAQAPERDVEAPPQKKAMSSPAGHAGQNGAHLCVLLSSWASCTALCSVEIFLGAQQIVRSWNTEFGCSMTRTTVLQVLGYVKSCWRPLLPLPNGLPLHKSA